MSHCLKAHEAIWHEALLLIAEHAEGIMATTGCPSGAVQTRLRLGQPDEAYRVAARYQEIFGKENYFLEIMDHGLEIEKRVRDGLLDISRKLGGTGAIRILENLGIQGAMIY